MTPAEADAAARMAQLKVKLEQRCGQVITDLNDAKRLLEEADPSGDGSLTVSVHGTAVVTMLAALASAQRLDADEMAALATPAAMAERIRIARTEAAAALASHQVREREAAERAAERERELRRKRKEAEEAERKELAVERKKAAAERKKREKAERAAEDERLRLEREALEEEVNARIRLDAQRAREEKVLSYWKGRCVALDYEPGMDGTSLLNDSCPICLCDFEPGLRIWRLHCKHAGCDECMEGYLKPKSMGGDASDERECPSIARRVCASALRCGRAEP